MRLGHTGTLVLQSRTLKNYNLKTFIESIRNYHACISVIYVHLKYMGRQLAMPKMNYLPLYTACIGTTPIQYRQDEY